VNWRCFVLLLAVTHGLNGQVASDRRASFTAGTGVTLVPTPPGALCGGGGGLELNAGFIVRPRGPWIVIADIRGASLTTSDCVAQLRAVDTTYEHTLPPDRYVTSTLRLGVETPARFPLLRFTAGAGAFLAGRPTSFVVVNAAWATRGEHVRLFLEAERTMTRIRGLVRHRDFGASQWDITESFSRFVSRGSYRIGMELPFGRQR